MNQSTWDRRLDYGATLEALGRRYDEEKLAAGARGGGDKVHDRAPFFVATLLTQLENGSRISEAFDCMGQWLETGERRQEVRLRKRGRLLYCQACKLSWKKRGTKGREAAARHTAETGHMLTEREAEQARVMFVSEFVLDEDRGPLTELFDAHTTPEAAQMFAARELGFNTHSLRFAFRSHAQAENVPSDIGRLITGHTSQEQYDAYLNSREAEDTLKRLMYHRSSVPSVRIESPQPT